MTASKQTMDEEDGRIQWATIELKNALEAALEKNARLTAALEAIRDLAMRANGRHSANVFNIGVMAAQALAEAGK